MNCDLHLICLILSKLHSLYFNAANLYSYKLYHACENHYDLYFIVCGFVYY